MRQRLSQAINRRFPRLSWQVWSSRRTLTQVSLEQVAPAARNLTSRVALSGLRPMRGSGATSSTTPGSLLLVVPSVDHEEIPWGPGQGNYSFELYETACAYLGADRVHTIRIATSEETENAHDRILTFTDEHRASHVLSRIDIEPNAGPHWSWDRFVKKVRARTNLIYLPLTYDSAYPYVSMHLDRITRLYSLAVPIVLDRPIQGVIRPRRPAAGPLFLPLSDASMTAINQALVGIEPTLDVTFIGNVGGYPYRAQLLEELDRSGIRVDVNPHGRSEGQLSSFVNYAAALRRSRITLNFTRCNGVPVTQLKTRMLEAPLFGAVVAADSSLYARDFFSLGEEFIAYVSPDDLKRQIEPLLSDHGRLHEMQRKAKSRADKLRLRNFWESADQAMVERGLQPLLPA